VSHAERRDSLPDVAAMKVCNFTVAIDHLVAAEVCPLLVVAFDVAFGGKADMGWCTAHVR